MLWIYQEYGVSDILLQEVGTKWTVDPVLFCYGIYVLVAFFVCVPRSRLARAAHRAPQLHPTIPAPRLLFVPEDQKRNAHGQEAHAGRAEADEPKVVNPDSASTPQEVVALHAHGVRKPEVSPPSDG